MTGEHSACLRQRREHSAAGRGLSEAHFADKPSLSDSRQAKVRKFPKPAAKKRRSAAEQTRVSRHPLRSGHRIIS
jgi:hypothetical protein